MVEEIGSSSATQAETLFDTTAPTQLTYRAAQEEKGEGIMAVMRPKEVTQDTDVLLYISGAGRELSFRSIHE